MPPPARKKQSLSGADHNGLPSSLAKQRVTRVVGVMMVLDTGLPRGIGIYIQKTLLSRFKQRELFVAMQLGDPRMQAQDVVMKVWELSAGPPKKISRLLTF